MAKPKVRSIREELGLQAQPVDWVNKYTPSSIEDFYGIKTQIKAVDHWFSEYKSLFRPDQEAVGTVGTVGSDGVDDYDYKMRKMSFKKALLFIGAPGTGKTTLARIMLKRHGFLPLEINSSNIKNTRLSSSRLSDISNGITVNNKMTGVIIDEVDGISGKGKGSMTELIGIINPNKIRKGAKKLDEINEQVQVLSTLPIICICNRSGYKKVETLIKECLCIDFNPPGVKDIANFLTSVNKREKMYMTQEVVNHLASASQADYRRMINIAQLVSSHTKSTRKSPIDMEEINTLEHLYVKKDVDKSSYDMGNKILQYKLTPSEAIRFYKTDKRKIPILIHENYVSFIERQKTTPFKRIENVLECINSLVISDMINKNMYNIQYWVKLGHVHGLVSSYIPSHYINKIARIKTKSNVTPVRLSRVVSRHSLARSVYHKIFALESYIEQPKSYTNTDMQQLFNIILHCLKGNVNHIRHGIAMMKRYNMKLDDIDKLSKIDKLEGISPITVTMKKQIGKYW